MKLSLRNKMENNKAMSKKKVALFGGSFNPIHNQHVKIIEKLIKGRIVDEVWVIPCKKHAFNKSFASARHRIKMINLATKHLPNVKISRVEMNSKGTTYTINTIRALKSRHNYYFFWVIGSDILYEIHKWNNYKQLFRQVRFILFKRKNYPIKKIRGMRIYHVFNFKVTNISSTGIREKTKKGKSLKGLVPYLVGRYIKKEGLYKQ